MYRSAFPSRPLRFETLEARENPAGNVSVELVNGLLVIQGDEFANSITVQVTDAQTLVTGVGTDINGDDTSATFTDAVTSIKASMFGGDDSIVGDLFTAFDLSGNLTVDMGDSETAAGDVFNLSTNANSITIGGNVNFTQGDGASSFTIAPGTVVEASATVGGKFAINHGSGDATNDISDTTLSSPATASITSKDGSDSLSLATVTAEGKLMVKGGVGNYTVDVTDGSNLKKGLTVAADGSADGIAAAGLTVNATASTISGVLTVASKSGVAFTADGLVAGVTKITGSKTGTVSATIVDTSDFTSLTLSGNATSLNVTGALTTSGGKKGDVSVLGRDAASLVMSGVNDVVIADSLTVKATAVGGDATLNLSGTSFTVAGKTTLSAKDSLTATLNTVELSDFTGVFTANGGTGADSFDASATFKASGGIKANFKGGANSFTLGNDGPATEVTSAGSVSYIGGVDVDTITLTRVNLASLSLITGAGNDVISIQNASTITGKTTINTASGEDNVQIANNAATNLNGGNTTFTGKAKFLLGGDDDTIVIGLESALNNDTLVTFSAMNNLLNGGSGTDTFIQETANFEGDLDLVSIESVPN